MNLHEYQAKEVLQDYGLQSPAGCVATTAAGAAAVARTLDGETFAVKAQVYAGGRAEAGGVRLVNSIADVEAAARELLGTRLVTSQTGPEGRPVTSVYVERAVEIAREVFLAALVDRTAGCLALIGSREAGTGIEEWLSDDAEGLEKMLVENPMQPEDADYQGFAERLGFDGAQRDGVAEFCRGLIRAMIALDASLIEINPLAITPSGDLLALDAKMILDDNALYRHPELAAMRDENELDAVELEAQRHEINMVQLDGNIGVIVNGAGLALATLDVLQDAGGQPANFMDIRTSAMSMQIAEGVSLVLKNPNVKVLLVNIHGGGFTRCDMIAEGIGIAFRRSGKSPPLVFRAAGNEVERAHTVLQNCGIKYIDAETMSKAAELAVALVGKAGA